MANTLQSPENKLPIPIGVDDFKKMIDQKYMYVDKTLLIKEFLETGADVILITRPRRFGKTISLSMLKYFFEKTEEPTAYLFEKTNIWKEEALKKQQGTYPVIFISFKDVKAENWDAAYEELKELLAREIRRTLKPIENILAEDYKKNTSPS